MIYDSMYMIFSKRQNHSARGSISGYKGLRVGRLYLQRESLRVFYGLNRSVLYPD